MSVSEDQLSRWAKAPSETEEGKCQTTVSRITDAIQKKFGTSVTVFLQGSYKNRTNVKKDSDVDIVVKYDDYYFPDTHFLSSNDKFAFEKGFTASKYTFARFKDDIMAILQGEYGYQVVERKEKCIKIHKNDYRVNADVIPCFVHKRMITAYSVGEEGIEFVTDSGGHIYSFPQQHYNNGVKKNKNTNMKYKSIVRILKNARNNMVDMQQLTDKDMPSFFLECLVWNVPNQVLNKFYLSTALRETIKKVWNDMRNPTIANDYAEICDLKWLFRGNSKRNYRQAEDFMLKAWNYFGFS